MYRIEMDALNAIVKQNERIISLLEQMTTNTTDEKPIIDKPHKRTYTRRKAQ